jgi:hypothetical protein
MAKPETPGIWRAVLAVVAVAGIFVGTIGFALWYADQLPVSSPALEQAKEEVRKSNPSHRPPSGDSWGIVHDSPIRK